MATPMQHSPKRGYSEKEAARYIGMSESFLRHGRINGRREGHIPPPQFIKAGKRKIIYLQEDLDAWLEQFSRAEHLARLQKTPIHQETKGANNE